MFESQQSAGYMLVAAAETAAAGAARAANVTSGIESLGLAGGHQVCCWHFEVGVDGCLFGGPAC
jgi:hypothetical protein